MFARAAAVVAAMALSSCVRAASPEPARYSGPIIDVHAHLVHPEELGSFAPGTRPGTGPLLEADHSAGVVTSALIVMAQPNELPRTRARNDEAKALADDSHGRLYPVGSVHPDDRDDALAELQRLHDAGFKVVKLHPNTQHFDVGSPAVAKLIEKTAELGLVVLFDAFSPWDANETGKFLLLAVTHPKARLILAHVGGSRFDEFGMFGMVDGGKLPWWPRNVWVDVSATAHFYARSPYSEQLKWMLRKLGTDRVLFGSDWPVEAPAHAVDDYASYGFTLDEQRQIFCTNAAALLELKVDCP